MIPRMTVSSAFQKVLILLFLVMVGPAVLAQPSIGQLVFRDVYVIPNHTRFQDTQVGGLSGIDYDAGSDSYYLICDDRSSLQPARYYKASIRIEGEKIDTVIFLEKVDFLAENGQTYPSARESRNRTIDPEGIRYNPMKQEVVWLSEGERIVNAKDTALADPEILISRGGKFAGRYLIADGAAMRLRDYGARQNGSFEALTFAEQFRTLWVALEEPLYQDGPRADVEDSPSLCRFFRYDVATRDLKAQYAYDLEPVAYAPLLTSAFRVNGITDILDAGNNKLLVLERSFSTGRLPCTVKIFLAEPATGTEVSKLASLKGDPQVKPMTKQLLLNMDSLGVHVDNVEGITWGPTLPNGHRTLLLVTDNNFQSFQKTQIFLLEVIP
ncbi:MAG: esterase-like activity of phytase family protein [Cyclobacteriaceae bacterium]|nr:esterase-like activity of phytase family protein [Cyclobacteriaceae bacterium]